MSLGRDDLRRWLTAPDASALFAEARAVGPSPRAPSAPPAAAAADAS